MNAEEGQNECESECVYTVEMAWITSEDRTSGKGTERSNKKRQEKNEKGWMNVSYLPRVCYFNSPTFIHWFAFRRASLCTIVDFGRQEKKFQIISCKWQW